MSILKTKKEITDTMKNREMRQLLRLQTLIDVIYLSIKKGLNRALFIRTLALIT